MEVLKLATEWAKSEVFSTRFFIFFAILFLAASAGFWQLGKTEIAKSYIIPFLVTGSLLLTIGLGLFYTNKSRVVQFEEAYNTDAPAFIKSEFERIDATLKEYKTIVFTIIPILITACALVLIFVDKPIWRASMITTIAMLIVILLVDGTAHARIDAYKKALEVAVDKK